MRNGSTPPTHGVGSRIGCPVAGSMSGCPVSRARRSAPTETARTGHRPASPRSSPRAAAAPRRSPALGRRVRYRGERVGVLRRRATPAGSPWSDAGCSGTVETMFVRIRYAAVATAASFEACAGEAPVQQVRPVVLRLDRVDRVVDRPLDHRHVHRRAEGAPPAGPGSPARVSTAIWFHAVTAFPVLTGGRVPAGAPSWPAPSRRATGRNR